MMFKEMNNRRLVGLQNWQSQTCEPSEVLLPSLFLSTSLHHPPFPPVLSLARSAFWWRQVSWDVDSGRLVEKDRSEKAADPWRPLWAPSSGTETAGLRSVLSFIICSVDHRMHYVCGGSVSAPPANRATEGGPHKPQKSPWGSKVSCFLNIVQFQEDRRINEIRQWGLVYTRDQNNTL